MRPASRYARFLTAPALLAALFFTAPAFAEEPTITISHYVVVTNDGSTYQGELVESIVGGHVTLKLATGEIVTFEARDIKSQGSALPAPSAPVIALPPPPPPAPPKHVPFAASFPGLFGGAPRAYDGPDAFHVHITSSQAEGASLAQESASGWVTVCQIPCTTTVDPKAMYQLQTMPGLMVPSAPFRFPHDAHEDSALELDANISSRLHHMGWGIGLVTVGPLLTVPGVFLLTGMFDGTGANGVPGSPSAAETVVGWTLVGASAAIVIAGVVLLAMPARSTLTDANGRRIAKRSGVSLGGGAEITPSGIVF
jgi:hypothetical protein